MSIKTFDPVAEMAEMDTDWLLNNGWTIDSNLAFRHILFEFNRDKKVLSLERIEQIIMQYNALDRVERIKSALAEWVDLLRDLRSELGGLS